VDPDPETPHIWLRLYGAFVALGDLTSREAVLGAIAEFDRVGREAFLSTYRFGPSRDYVVVHDGKSTTPRRS
jgi:5-methylcytosine-specific restriction protein A